MRTVLIIILISVIHPLFAQIDGENVFGTNQVIKFEITFSDPAFWDSLTAYYTTTQQYMAADVTITDQSGTYHFSNVGIRLKGNSSYSHPGNKKSFKIDFNEYVPGQNYDGLKKLNFSNCFKDPSFIREKIFSDICQENDIPAPRANYANVYINSIHWGFYTLVEQIDDQFLDWAILDDNGNLFKAGDNFKGAGNEADLKYYGAIDSNYYSKYELKTNETANDWSDLIALIDFINNTSDEQFETGLDGYIEKTDFLHSMALDNLFSNLDSYLNSARNYYLYHNLTSYKWEWIKWDLNETFGNYGGGPGTGDLTKLAPNYYAANRPLIARVFKSNSLYNEYLIRLCSLKDYIDSTTIFPMIDSLVDLISSFVYADNNKMYSNADFDTNIHSDISSGGGPGGGTIYGLKSFITQKEAYLKNQIDCSLYTSTQDLNITPAINIYPNPTTGILNILLQKTENDIELNVYDITGRVVFTAKNDLLQRVIINLENLKNGIYFVEIKSRNYVATKKVMLLRP